MSVRQGNNTIAGAVGKYPLNERNITNCITEIPQDIKLELNNGTLTLKAGSKVYVPNGVGVFDILTIQNDLTVNYGSVANGNYMVFVSSDGTSALRIVAGQCHSGTTQPTGLVYPNNIWYDTTNNIIKYTTDNGTTYSGKYSFPLCIAISSGTAWLNIDQIFNGFGYIGSTVFALPGVKGLIPDGRNADGSLKSIEVTVNNVLTHTGSYNNQPQWIILYSDSINSWDSVYWIGYNSQENILFNKEGSSSATSGSKIMACVCMFLSADGNQKITSFKSKKAFRTVDYNDTEYIAHQAMPSNRYIDLTLGASGATYVAPADGYFTYMDISGGVGLASLADWNNGLVSGINAPSSTWARRVFLPAKKGDTVQLIYENGGTNQTFRFIYAQGAQ